MNYKKTGLLLLGALFILGTAIASGKRVKGTGPVVSETRKVSAFQDVALYIAADVYITEGSEFAIEVRAQKEIVQILQTDVAGPALAIKYPSGSNVRSSEPVSVYITLPAVHALSINGSGTINAPKPLHAEQLKLKVDGSGDIQLSYISATDVLANVNGSGSIKVKKGDAQTAAVQVNGSGSMESRGLRVANAAVQIAGSGNAALQVSGQLSIAIDGSGTVSYGGDAQVSSQVNGSGSVQKF
jgi:hypothetical protein